MSKLPGLDMADDSLESTDVSTRVVGTTQGGKDLVIFQTKQGYHGVKFTTGGQLPLKLTGKYLRYEDAEYAVNTYLITEQPKLKGLKNAKSRSKGKL